MKPCILGIDPGLYGALAVLDRRTGSITCYDFPTMDVGGKGKRKVVLDEYQLARLVDSLAADVETAWLEKVASRPGEGAVGAFSFGRTYGLIRGIICANFLPLEEVTPQVWKAALRVPGDKDQARARASALFPRAAHQWPLKKHDGRAEAALIAHYGASIRGPRVAAGV